MTKIILPLDFLFWGGMQTAACGDEDLYVGTDAFETLWRKRTND